MYINTSSRPPGIYHNIIGTSNLAIKLNISYVHVLNAEREPDAERVRQNRCVIVFDQSERSVRSAPCIKLPQGFEERQILYSRFECNNNNDNAYYITKKKKSFRADRHRTYSYYTAAATTEKIRARAPRVYHSIICTYIVSYT